MNKTTILVVDDDMSLAALVTRGLKAEGYAVEHAKNSDAAFSYLQGAKPALILLDINLPGISGLKLLDILKKDERTAELPVIMMTMQSGTESKVEGLRGGADDYIVKPFSMKELVARVAALLRRTQHGGKVDRVRQVGAIQIDFDRLEVKVKDKQVKLTPAEFQILALLSEHPGRVYSYAALREGLAQNKDITSEMIYSHVKNLRKKLGSAGDAVETVYGTGYKFSSPD